MFVLIVKNLTTKNSNVGKKEEEHFDRSKKEAVTEREVE